MRKLRFRKIKYLAQDLRTNNRCTKNSNIILSNQCSLSHPFFGTRRECKQIEIIELHILSENLWTKPTSNKSSNIHFFFLTQTQNLQDSIMLKAASYSIYTVFWKTRRERSVSFPRIYYKSYCHWLYLDEVHLNVLNFFNQIN